MTAPKITATPTDAGDIRVVCHSDSPTGGCARFLTPTEARSLAAQLLAAADRQGSSFSLTQDTPNPSRSL